MSYVAKETTTQASIELVNSLPAFRLVLINAMERRVAVACLGAPVDEAVSLWPSGIYGTLALAAAQSSLLWQRCRTLLDASFGPLSSRFFDTPPMQIAEVFAQARGNLSSFELAAMIWALLRRSEACLDRLILRLGAELEVVALQRNSRRHWCGRLAAVAHE